MEQIEEVSTLVTLLNRHQEEIAGVWAEMVHSLPDSHYSERPLDELRASTLRAVEAIIEALTTHSYTALETYLTDVSLTRLQMGFDIAEVIEALLLCKEATLPIILESYSPRSPEASEAIVQLDGCLLFILPAKAGRTDGQQHGRTQKRNRNMGARAVWRHRRGGNCTLGSHEPSSVAGGFVGGKSKSCRRVGSHRNFGLTIRSRSSTRLPGKRMQKNAVVHRGDD